MLKLITLSTLILTLAFFAYFPEETEARSHYVAYTYTYWYYRWYAQPYYYTYCTHWWYYNYWYNWYWYRYYWWYGYRGYCWTSWSYNYYWVLTWRTAIGYRCDSSWTGTFCDVPICNPKCTESNVCQDINDVPTCSCKLNAGVCVLGACSNTLNCYPGYCDIGNTCKCPPGFSGPNCQTMGKRSTIPDCSAKIYGKMSTNGVEQVVAQADICTPEGLDVDPPTIWIGTNLVTQIQMDWEAHFNPQNLPDGRVAPYVVNAPTPIGIDSTGYKISSEYGVNYGSVSCPVTNKYLSIVQCKTISKQWSGLGLTPTNNASFIMEVTSTIGGVKKGNTAVTNGGFSDQYFTESSGNVTSRKVKFAFDFEKPTHCLEIGVNCSVFPIALNNTLTNDPKLVPKFNDWSDAHSGIDRYNAEVFYMQPDTAGLLVEVESLTKKDVNVTLDDFYFVCPKPGTYSIVLTAYDKANNTRKARKIVTYNDKPIIETDVPMTVKGTMANDDNTLYFLKSLDQLADVSGGFKRFTLNWTGHFKNNYQSEWLARVKPWQDLSIDGIDDQYGTKYGVRSIDAVDKSKLIGITGYSYAYKIDDNFGLVAAPDNYTYIESTTDYLNIDIPTSSVVSGKTLVIWLNAYSIESTMTLVSKTYFDFDPSSIVISGTVFRKVPDDDGYSELDLTVKNAVGGLRQVNYTITTGGSEPTTIVSKVQPIKQRKKTLNKRKREDIIDVPCDPSANNTNCYCTPLGPCFDNVQKIIINNCDIDKYKQLGIIINYNVISLSGQSLPGFKKLDSAELDGLVCRSQSLTGGQKAGIAIGVILAIALLIAICVVLFLYKKRPNTIVATRMKTMATAVTGNLRGVGRDLEANDLYVSKEDYIASTKQPQYRAVKVTDENQQSSGFQVNSNDVKISSDIAEGRFAVIQKGTLNKDGASIPVAVKSLKKNYLEKDDEIMRSKILFMASKVKPHPCIVKFYGAIQDEYDNPAMLLECCDMNLKDWLTSINKVNLEELENMLNFSIYIASGVQHLHASNIIHKRLAARNVLLKRGSNGLEAKITGFGPSRDTSDDSNDSKSQNVVPMKWCAPETLDTLSSKNPTYNEKTDAWSYGIVLWEIYSKGKAPFDNYRSNEIKDYLKKGVRLDCPEDCPKEIFEQTMKKCWEASPKNRPTFKTIYSGLIGYRNGAQGANQGYYSAGKDDDQNVYEDGNMAGYYDAS